jgi:hypothetical protein
MITIVLMLQISSCLVSVSHTPFNGLELPSRITKVVEQDIVTAVCPSFQREPQPDIYGNQSRNCIIVIPKGECRSVEKSMGEVDPGGGCSAELVDFCYHATLERAFTFSSEPTKSTLKPAPFICLSGSATM